METPITLSYILKIYEINPQIIYNVIVEGLEIERIKLQANASAYNAAGYVLSLQKIQQYYRILSVFRGETLNAIIGRKQSGN